MVTTLTAYNPDEALCKGLRLLRDNGVESSSRVGRVLQAYGPVVTTYKTPQQRVIFGSLRDANPFFHLFESLWMLAGRNDVAKVANYAKQMESFADDGLQWGAYGWRWREFFEFDQLAVIVNMLRKDPSTRRAVLTMWAPNGDLVPKDFLTDVGDGVSDPVTLHKGGPAAKDIPCNTHIYFDATRNVLDMTVCNRSNDIVWGAYGANLVHMSMLHEFVARAINMPQGEYHQLSNNFHAYIERPDVLRLFNRVPGERRDGWEVIATARSPYDGKLEPDVWSTGMTTLPRVSPYAIMSGETDWRNWLVTCEEFVGDIEKPLPLRADAFFRLVAQPLMRAHAAYKTGDYILAQRFATNCMASDWSWAAMQWLQRRQMAAARKGTA